MIQELFKVVMLELHAVIFWTPETSWMILVNIVSSSYNAYFYYYFIFHNPTVQKQPHYTALMLYKQWLGAKCTVTVNSGQNNANKIEWGNDISLMKRLGNICLTVICHLDTSTCTKLRYYIKLLVRSCSSWGNMTDLGLYGGWACAQMIKDRNVDTS